MSNKILVPVGSRYIIGVDPGLLDETATMFLVTQAELDAHIQAAVLAEQQKWSGEGWDNQPLPEDEAILEAHPIKSDDYASWNDATRLVGATKSKFALVGLVNWLLVEKKKAVLAERKRCAAVCRAIEAEYMRKGDKCPQDAQHYYDFSDVAGDCAEKIREAE